MAYSEDHIVLAAEYALGTLDAAERTQVDAMMATDPGFAALVEAWERKLGALNQMVGAVEPRAVGVEPPVQPEVIQAHHLGQLLFFRRALRHDDSPLPCLHRLRSARSSTV